MSNKSSKRTLARAVASKLAEDFRALSHKILHYANRGLPRTDFAREVSKMLIDFSGCDVIELRLKRQERYFLCQTARDGEPHFTCEQRPCTKAQDGRMIPCSDEDSAMENLCRDIILGQVDHSLPFFTKNAGFWTGEAIKLQVKRLASAREPDDQSCCLGGDYPSLAFFPLVVDGDNVGLLLLKSKKQDYFLDEEIEFYEGLAQTLGVAMVQRAAQVALRERIKELTCLYGIAQLSAKPGISLEAIMQGIVELIPPAWFYPQIAAGRIILDGRSYTTPGFQEGGQRQTAEIVIGGEHRGMLEVTYLEERPELDEGPFLKEERSLIDAMAREAAIIIERRQTEEEKSRLQDQLRHADRLATIGQLAAGVAHELNEPLGNALGFAQLAKKCPGLPEQAEQDVEKAVLASLRAREVIKKLMLFARRMPPKKTQVNLNQLVEEGLYFLESRCAKEGIELVRFLSPNLPEITADPGQLTQVLVNLVVNAVQAMPDGGKLTVETHVGDGYISLTVEDTGVGMSDKVAQKIFMPFFTTKDVDQGTGLGLAVVHGIVTSHGGSIKVDSKVGRGTRFEVKLPLAGAPDVEETE
ncbi:MAG: ATP-binding protein [Candidatus Zixiibacteriota bacterium]